MRPLSIHAAIRSYSDFELGDVMAREKLGEMVPPFSTDQWARLVKAAYTEGYGEGMDEHRKFNGGKSWEESAAYVIVNRAVQS